MFFPYAEIVDSKSEEDEEECGKVFIELFSPQYQTFDISVVMWIRFVSWEVGELVIGGKIHMSGEVNEDMQKGTNS